jgi:hypothetical protein
MLLSFTYVAFTLQDLNFLEALSIPTMTDCMKDIAADADPNLGGRFW